MPEANASKYAPVPGRARWWLSVRCPYCGGNHLCRLADESDAPGKRKLRCGWVKVKVRATYPADAGREAA